MNSCRKYWNKKQRWMSFERNTRTSNVLEVVQTYHQLISIGHKHLSFVLLETTWQIRVEMGDFLFQTCETVDLKSWKECSSTCLFIWRGPLAVWSGSLTAIIRLEATFSDAASFKRLIDVMWLNKMTWAKHLKNFGIRETFFRKVMVLWKIAASGGETAGNMLIEYLEKQPTQ